VSNVVTTDARGVPLSENLRPDGLPQTQSRWAGTVPAAVFAPVELAGGLAQLAGRVLWSAISRPRGYWGVVRDEMYAVLRVSWFPMVLAVFTFGLMVGILGLNFVGLLGAANRYGQYFFIVNIREFTPWINSMVVAGIIGTALCADLGARRTREELDALAVMGVDPVRKLVLPRVVVTTLLTPALMLVSLFVGIFCGLVSSATYGAVPVADYLDTVLRNLTGVEIALAMVKSTLIGFTVGVVSAQYGLTATGGPIGVGKAVNQSVVLSFVLVFVIDGVLNVVALGLFPEMGSVR
jgi:phospholipid/cholesterol/gamma-HCH transport system permease protein